jgi:hypothetical protein
METAEEKTLKLVGVETAVHGNPRKPLERAVTERKLCGLWVNKYGQLVTISLEPRQDEDDLLRLMEEVSTPSFPVASAARGRLIDKDGNLVELDDLPRLIKDAKAERIRFYTEREKESGLSAWPGGVRSTGSEATETMNLEEARELADLTARIVANLEIINADDTDLEELLKTTSTIVENLKTTEAV